MAIADEEAALQAVQSFADDLSEKQRLARERIDNVNSSVEPFVDIFELFNDFDVLYFRSLLAPRVEVSWRPRLTLCAGICELVKDPDNDNKLTRIRLKLSEPLLKYRPKSDVIDTLLHESIHAYFFVTTDWKHIRGDDGTGHGPGFLLLADAVNSHGGYSVSVYHNFHDEVDSYRTHIWQCDGVCKDRSPFFGLAKRSMNRPPGPNDHWWQRHQKECGGTFNKVSEPEPSKSQLQRLTGLERAGRQSNKIDGWVTRQGARQDTPAKSNEKLVSETENRTDRVNDRDGRFAGPEQPNEIVECPVCGQPIGTDDINDHLDHLHSS